MAVLRTALGAILAAGLSFTAYFVIFLLLGGEGAAIIVGVLAAALGLAYGIVAFYKNIYGLAFFSLFGFFLDMSWSMINTVAGLLVWLPISAVSGGAFVSPNSDTRRSGCFVYSDNPRGGGYHATTIGTVIAGGWDSHEETHVWQARIFGPFYMAIYGVSWLLNLLALSVLLRFQNISMEAYRRICWEDWAYLGGTHGARIHWPGWIGGFFLCVLYVACIVAIPVGIGLGAHWLWLSALGILLLYSVIRALIK